MTPHERAAAITEAEGPRIQKLIRLATDLVDAKVPAQMKGERIMDVADALSRTITPHTECARGCSHCCHMATCLSGFEARMIGRYVGREPARLGREMVASLDLERELQARYTGVPCPFLVAGKCSVYPVRPAACRLHHSLMEDADNCRIRDNREPITVAHLNLLTVQMALAAVFMADDFGDIREFFPSI